MSALSFDLEEALLADLAFELDLAVDLLDDFLVEDLVLLFFEPLRQCALTDTLSLRTKDFTQLQPVEQADCERPLHSCALAEVANSAVVNNAANIAMVFKNFMMCPLVVKLQVS